MNFIEKLRSAITGGAIKGDDSNDRLYIFDTRQMAGTNGGRNSPSPRDQFKALQRISRFVEREKIAALAVFEGRPLNEAADGSNYNGVEVHYADKASGIPDRIISLFDKRRGRKAVTVITSDRELEKHLLEAGCQVMRLSTLRKAMDNGGISNGDRNRGTRRGRRPKRRKADGQQQTEAKETGNGKQDSGVHDLIDLVD